MTATANNLTWKTSQAHAEHAYALKATGRTEEARPYFREAHDAILAALGADHPQVVELAKQI